jgi:hypothetical protein
LASARTNTSLVEDLLLEIVSDALDVGAIVLGEVLVFERRVQLDERGADPGIERLDVSAHRGDANRACRMPFGAVLGRLA